MTTPAAILAAALSLVSTNDYVLTRPHPCEICGVGMGAAGDYDIVRGEDLAFLREAYAERFRALGGSGQYMWDPSSGLTNSLAPSSGTLDHYNGEDIASSFAPTFGRWKKRSRYTGPGFFVSPDIQFPDDDFAASDADYLYNGRSTDSTNGPCAFIPIHDFAVAGLATNITVGLMSNGTGAKTPFLKSDIMRAYSNVVVSADIVARCGLAEGDDIRPLTRSIYHTYREGDEEISRSTEQYTYVDDRGFERVGFYDTAVNLRPYKRESLSTNSTIRPVSSIKTLTLSCESHVTQPYTYKQNSYPYAAKYSYLKVGGTYSYWQRNDEFELGGGMMRIKSRCLQPELTTQATCRVFTILRVAANLTERLSGFTTHNYTTNRTIYAVGTASGVAERLQTDPSYFVSDIDIVEALRYILASDGVEWVYAVPAPVIDVEYTSGSSLTIPGQGISALLRRDMKITNIDIYPYVFLKAPNFNARVL